jgi:hypothetical protein
MIGTGTPIDTEIPPCAMAEALHNKRAAPANIPAVATTKDFLMIMILLHGRTISLASLLTHDNAAPSAKFNND